MEGPKELKDLRENLYKNHKDPHLRNRSTLLLNKCILRAQPPWPGKKENKLIFLLLLHHLSSHPQLKQQRNNRILLNINLVTPSERIKITETRGKISIFLEMKNLQTEQSIV